MLGRLLPPLLGSQVFCEMVLCFAFLPPATAIDNGSSLLTVTNLKPHPGQQYSSAAKYSLNFGEIASL